MSIIKRVVSAGLCGTLLSLSAITEPVLAFQSASPNAAPPVNANRSSAPAAPRQTADQLDALVAPIALYPDALVAQILAAATEPNQVAIADDWLHQHNKLQGTDLTKKVDQQTWDPSVKALTQFPSVLDNLAQNLTWTSNLGQAFGNQQADVMTAVQAMRARARLAGNLKSNSQIKVVQQKPGTIVIQPVNPQVVYVPIYNPMLVYGIPYRSPFYRPPVVVVTPALSFSAGIALGAAIGGGGFVGGGWGFGAWGMNWGGVGGGGTVIYNHNTYVTKNINNSVRNRVINNNNSIPGGNNNSNNAYQPGGRGPHGSGPGGTDRPNAFRPGEGRSPYAGRGEAERAERAGSATGREARPESGRAEKNRETREGRMERNRGAENKRRAERAKPQMEARRQPHREG